ncbi:2-oxoacid ferredoxin oxidoreductase [Candidatus Curtissbacteria bacterium]|nr:2-oxoacid ferredoxin oxidoreductase [Candidatus Curtissbacteria bacterium]
MSITQDFDSGCFPNWCAGCGDFGIWAAIKSALVKLNIAPHEVTLVYGVGCHGHMVNFMHAYGFEGLHGRPVPVAVGAKIANHTQHVIVVAGDGDTYGEGLNHLLAAMRGNHDITVIIHNNGVYGLTTGQSSPTATKGYQSKSTPEGVIETALNPLALAVISGATFVSRGFAGDITQLTDLIVEGINHKGFSLVDALQPCVTFNKINTYQWYREKIVKLQDLGHDFENVQEAIKIAMQDDPIATGIIYKTLKSTYESELRQLDKGTLVTKPVSTPHNLLDNLSTGNTNAT